MQWHAANVLHNVPEREDAKDIRVEAMRENAKKAADRGRECESQQKFGAALIEYRVAQRTDATLPGIEQDIARMMDRNVCRGGPNLRIVQAIRLAADRMRGTSTATGGVR